MKPNELKIRGWYATDKEDGTTFIELHNGFDGIVIDWEELVSKAKQGRTDRFLMQTAEEFEAQHFAAECRRELDFGARAEKRFAEYLTAGIEARK